VYLTLSLGIKYSTLDLFLTPVIVREPRLCDIGHTYNANDVSHFVFFELRITFVNHRFRWTFM